MNEHMWFVAMWILAAGIGYAIGEHKGHPIIGLILGFLFGVFGVVAIALFPRTLAKKAEEQKKIDSINNNG